MTNDDAKYREWWEKLKGELKDALAEQLYIDDILGASLTRNKLNRMLQIEKGEK